MADDLPTSPPPTPAGEWYTTPAGELRQIPASQAPDAELIGWTPATPEQIRESQLQQTYGGTGGQIVTGGLAALRALTFGGSDVLGVKIGQLAGMSKEEAQQGLRELREANPASDTAGTILGVAAPLLATMGADAPLAGAQGADALATAARFTGPGAVARLGSAVTKGVEAALPEAEGLVGRIASEAIAAGAGSAVEGAAYDAGQVVSEDALGDPNLTAQSALATIGLSAALGGGLGGALGAAGEAFPIALKKVGESLSSAVQKAKEAYPELAERLTGVSADTVRDLQQKIGSAFTDPKQAWKLQTNLGTHLEDLGNSLADAQKELYSSARPAETADLIRGESAWDLKPLTSAQRALDGIESAVKTIRADPDLYEQGFAAKLEQIGNGLSRRIADGDAVKVFEELRQARQQIDSFGKWSGKGLSMLPFKEREAVQLVRDVRGIVREAITDPEAWGPAAVRQAALDEAHSEYAQALKQISGGGLGPLRSNILPKVTVAGQEELRVNPRALKTFLNQMADPRGAQYVGEALGEYLTAAQKYADAMQESFQHVPASNFSREALTDLVGKTGDLFEQAKQQASVTQIMNELSPNATFGAGGAKALLPMGTNAGAAEGAGMLAAAPLLGHMIPGAGPVAAVYGGAKALYHTVAGLKNVPQTVATLARLERMAQKVAAAIDTGASTLVRGGVKAANVGRAEAVAGIAREFSSTPEAATARFSRRVAEVQKLSQDPEALHRAIVAQNEGIDQHAPNTSQALAVTSARGIAFLASKMPQAPMRGPLAPKWEPSQSEIAKFSRYYEAVQDPLVVLKQAAAGTLTKEAVEAVQTVYPELYAKIQAGLLAKIATHGTDVPRRSRLMLGALLGQDVDGSMAGMLANQAVFRAPSRQQSGLKAPAVKPSVRGMEKVTVASRLMTPMQASASRRGNP